MSVPDPADSAIRIFGLRYKYPGTDHDVLQIPSLDIPRRGLTAITGPSGSGKSTLVELIAGTLRELYAGDIVVLGVNLNNLKRDADRQKHLRRIGLIPQDFGLLATSTVREILSQDLADSGVTRTERDQRITAALNQVELSKFIDRKSAMLSGGQRQRVAIARMLARNVELVIADEPTANLDPTLVDGVVAVFKDLAKTRPVVIVTHDTRVSEMCDHSVEIPTPTDVQRARGDTDTLRWWHVAVPLLVLAFLGGGVLTAVLVSSPRQSSSPTPSATGPSLVLSRTCPAPSLITTAMGDTYKGPAPDNAAGLPVCVYDDSAGNEVNVIFTAPMESQSQFQSREAGIGPPLSGLGTAAVGGTTDGQAVEVDVYVTSAAGFNVTMNTPTITVTQANLTEVEAVAHAVLAG